MSTQYTIIITVSKDSSCIGVEGEQSSVTIGNSEVNKSVDRRGFGVKKSMDYRLCNIY